MMNNYDSLLEELERSAEGRALSTALRAHCDDQQSAQTLARQAYTLADKARELPDDVLRAMFDLLPAFDDVAPFRDRRRYVAGLLARRLITRDRFNGRPHAVQVDVADRTGELGLVDKPPLIYHTLSERTMREPTDEQELAESVHADNWQGVPAAAMSELRYAHGIPDDEPSPVDLDTLSRALDGARSRIYRTTTGWATLHLPYTFSGGEYTAYISITRIRETDPD